MNWRGIADVLLRRSSPPESERSTKAAAADRLIAEVQETVNEIRALRTGAQYRLASYRRVRLHR